MQCVSAVFLQETIQKRVGTLLRRANRFVYNTQITQRWERKSGFAGF